MNAFHVVPLSVLMKVNMSLLPLVDVSVGAAPPDHLNDGEGQVTLLGVPSAVKINTKFIAFEAVADTFVSVNVVIGEFSDTSNIVALAKSNVRVFDDIVGAASAST